MTCKFPFSHVNCGIKLCIICQKSSKPCVLLFKKFCCLIWLVISCLVKILLDCICWPSNRITCRIRGSAPLLAWYVISQMFYCYNRCTFEKFGIWVIFHKYICHLQLWCLLPWTSLLVMRIPKLFLILRFKEELTEIFKVKDITEYWQNRQSLIHVH